MDQAKATMLFETDWLGSKPVFYNERSGKVSYNINDVIDYANLEFDPDGLNNYLDFGYSVFEQTPVKYVKFLRHSARLVGDVNGKLNVQYLDDPMQQWLDRQSSEDDVMELLYSKVREWEHSARGEIVIPTSGGYDSRLLNFVIEDKSRILSYTYGISEKQTDSFEVIYAKELSKKLGTRWSQIFLGDQHLYFKDWDELFGISVHAHGMYHVEFYKKILSAIGEGKPLLSGIIGDAWAGSVNISEISSPHDVYKLGYTHGMQSDSNQSRFVNTHSGLENYFELHRDQLRDTRIRVVEAMRFKLLLLSYLHIVPDALGFEAWSPFLDVNVAMSMLTLPPERRQDRLWQKELFQKNGLDFESLGIDVSRQKSLTYRAMKRIPLIPLDSKLLAEVVKPDYVNWVNSQIGQQGPFWDWFWSLNHVPKVSGVIRLLGVQDRRLMAYNAYLVLKPIEFLLLKRNQIVL